MIMSLIINMPEWAQERHIYVFAGIELLAYKLKGRELKVKTSRCSMCGKCCVIRGEPCQHLVADGKDKMVCDYGLARPFSCSIGRGAARVPECTERFESV